MTTRVLHYLTPRPSACSLLRILALIILPSVAGVAGGLSVARHVLVAESGHNEAQIGEVPAGVRAETDVPMRMRDGVELFADVYLPQASGRFPAILVRTPYNRRAASVLYYRTFATHGYAVVLQDVRGRYGSQGEFGWIQQEGPDGNDTLNWIAAQPWSNRRIGMAGSSYIGIVQWWAAIQENPHLGAIFPVVSGDDEYLDRFYSPGGALKLGHRLFWLAENFHPPGVREAPLPSYIEHLPLRTADILAAGRTLPVWQNALNHPSYDSYWEQISIRGKMDRVRVPVFSMGGWFDNYAESDLDAFARLAHLDRDVETWIGPWAHSFSEHFPTVDFGPRSRVPIRQMQLEFFDRYLKGAIDQPAPKPRLHLFVMGADVWREEHEWPLARTVFTPFYLEGGGSANSAAGDGGLTSSAPKKSKPDHFVYDPLLPVPTQGGAICCNASALPDGPLDQSTVEKRRDVLVYTSGILADDIEATGPVRATLYVATSANDTDFTVKLVDLAPSGTPLLVTDGLVRMRYRVSLRDASFVKHDSPYQVTVDGGVTSYVFRAGHRIRVEVSSSNFPRFDRNLNIVGANADGVRPQRATQTVFHERKYPSAIYLPVIPRVRPPAVEQPRDFLREQPPTLHPNLINQKIQ